MPPYISLSTRASVRCIIHASEKSMFYIYSCIKPGYNPRNGIGTCFQWVPEDCYNLPAYTGTSFQIVILPREWACNVKLRRDRMEKWPHIEPYVYLRRWQRPARSQSVTHRYTAAHTHFLFTPLPGCIHGGASFSLCLTRCRTLCACAC